MEWQEPQVITYGSYKILIRRPVLTKNEREKREGQIKASLESVMRSYIRRKEKKDGDNNTSGAVNEEQILDRQT